MDNEETKEAPEAQETQDNAPVPEDLEAIKAQLEEEKKAKAAAEAAAAERDSRIATLEAELSEARKGSEAAAAELSQVKEAHGQVVPNTSMPSGLPIPPSLKTSSPAIPSWR